MLCTTTQVIKLDAYCKHACILTAACSTAYTSTHPLLRTSNNDHAYLRNMLTHPGCLCRALLKLCGCPSLAVKGRGVFAAIGQPVSSGSCKIDGIYQQLTSKTALVSKSCCLFRGFNGLCGAGIIQFIVPDSYQAIGRQEIRHIKLPNQNVCVYIPDD